MIMVKALETLGLTGKETQAYRCLLRQGISTAQQMSQLLGVSSPRCTASSSPSRRRAGSRSRENAQTATVHARRGSSRRRRGKDAWTT